MVDREVVVNGPAALSTQLVERAVQYVLTSEQREAAISITFISVNSMRRMNHEHKGHDYPTDVISFALPQPDGSLAGDIYLCRYQAAKNARQAGVGTRTELLRLIVHGTLHVLGWDHPEDEGRTSSPMWSRQESLVAEFVK